MASFTYHNEAARLDRPDVVETLLAPGQAGIVALLLDKGAEINVQENSGATPLYQAAAWGRLETVDLLVRKGADTSIRTREGISPLQAAIANQHQMVVERLRD